MLQLSAKNCTNFVTAKNYLMQKPKFIAAICCPLIMAIINLLQRKL